MRHRLIGLASMGYLVVVAVGVFGPEPGGLLDRVEQGLRSPFLERTGEGGTGDAMARRPSLALSEVLNYSLW